MPTWKFDSYCNDNVMEYISDFEISDLLISVENQMWDYINFELNTEMDLEFLIGVSMYCIRLEHQFSKKYLLELRNVIDNLLKNGKFSYWKDIEKRKTKILHERLIINNILSGNKPKFGPIITKPKSFTDLNPDY